MYLLPKIKRVIGTTRIQLSKIGNRIQWTIKLEPDEIQKIDNLHQEICSHLDPEDCLEIKSLRKFNLEEVREIVNPRVGETLEIVNRDLEDIRENENQGIDLLPDKEEIIGQFLRRKIKKLESLQYQWKINAMMIELHQRIDLSPEIERLRRKLYDHHVTLPRKIRTSTEIHEANHLQEIEKNLLLKKVL